MYQDIEYKLNYHKEKVIQGFIKRGIYPNNELVQSQLNSIELRLAIFKSPSIKEGSVFDTKEFNEAIKSIYADLAILYQLLHDITVKEYNKLSYYIDSHLRELNDMATMYLKRAELESYSTALGKSIYFSHSGFEIESYGDSSIIKLGKVDISDAAEVACVGNINNTNYENVVFKFKTKVTNDDGKEEDRIISCNAYNYNHDSVVFPGNKNRDTYEISINDSQKVNSILELPVIISGTDNSTFTTMAGKGMILYKKADENGEILEEKPVALDALAFEGHSYIDFYVVGGSNIRFRFNKKPIATNFNTETGAIETLDYIHHFFIECGEGFSFDFELEEGVVYAMKENTLIEDEKVYYSGKMDMKDFLLVQEHEGEKRSYDATVEIRHAAITADDIESIMIKKVQ